MSERRVSLLFFCIIGVAFFLRLGGIGWSLPLLWHEDEKTTVARAMKVGKGVFDPEWFGYPNGPMIYGLGGVFRFGHLLAEYMVPEAVPSYEEAVAYKDGVWFYGLGRVMMALLGTCIVGVIYRIGRLRIGKAGALIAAWLTAIQPMLVEQSHYITPDSTQTLFIACVLLWLVRWQESQGKKISALVAAGVFFGLAVGTKYPSVVAAYFPIVFLIGLGRKQWKKIVVYLVMIGAIGVVVFLVTNPYVLVSFNTVLHNIQKEARPNHPGQDPLSFFGNVWYYLTTTLVERSSIAFTLLSLLSFCLSIVRKERRLLQIFVFVPVYLFFISSLSLYWIRWATPLFPFLCLGIGWLFHRVLMWAHRLRYRSAMIASIAAVWTGLFLTSAFIGTNTLRVTAGFICRGEVKYRDERFVITPREAWSFHCPDRGLRKGH